MYPIIHFSLPSYAVMAMLAAFASVIFLYFRIDRFELQFNCFLSMSLLCALYGVLGSRVLFVVSRIPWLMFNFSLNNALITIIGGGFVFYGGLLGVLFGIKTYCKKHSLNLHKVLNCVTPAIPLFHAIGRVGCFLSGCCYGKELSSPMVMFGVLKVTRIPTQLIEAVFEMSLFIVILILGRHKTNYNLLKIYMTSYAVFRFIIEFWRGDTLRGFFLGISTSQIVSICIIIFYLVKSIRTKYNDQTRVVA